MATPNEGFTLDGDDTVVSNLVFTLDHRGIGANSCMFTPIRVVCNNTWQLAKDTARDVVKHNLNRFILRESHPKRCAVYIACHKTFLPKSQHNIMATPYILLERCTVECKDAADMLVAYRIGGLVNLGCLNSITKVYVLSRDKAFNMICACLKADCPHVEVRTLCDINK